MFCVVCSELYYAHHFFIHPSYSSKQISLPLSLYQSQCVCVCVCVLSLVLSQEKNKQGHNTQKQESFYTQTSAREHATSSMKMPQQQSEQK